MHLARVDIHLRHDNMNCAKRIPYRFQRSAISLFFPYVTQARAVS